jgi:hypothetical protein
MIPDTLHRKTWPIKEGSGWVQEGERLPEILSGWKRTHLFFDEYDPERGVFVRWIDRQIIRQAE